MRRLILSATCITWSAGPKVIVLSSKPQTRAATLAAGAEGFISKDVPPDELLPLLRKMRSSDIPAPVQGPATAATSV